MDQVTQQDSDKQQAAISPLAQDKTYGERVYRGVFDWGLNYWTNLLASAGFSQWTANTTQHMPLTQTTPREMQANLGNWMSKQFFLQGYKKKQLLECGVTEASEKLAKGEITAEAAGKMIGEATKLAEKNLHSRGFAMAESLTLLIPGFVVMIPSVWLGAKIKPWFVKKMNEMHYGKEAMQDPTMQARQQAIETEIRPSLLGTIVARLGTVGAVQLTAKFIGSKNNTVNDIGKITNIEPLQKFAGVNPTAAEIGKEIGNRLPKSMQKAANDIAEKWNLSWSDQQIAEGKTGKYDQALQDLGKYIAMDTIYTFVSSSTIHPLLHFLRKIPGMSYQPKAGKVDATLENGTIKVPPNHYADLADTASPAETLTPPQAANQNFAAANENPPKPTVTQVSEHTAPARSEPQLA